MEFELIILITLMICYEIFNITKKYRTNIADSVSDSFEAMLIMSVGLAMILLSLKQLIS